MWYVYANVLSYRHTKHIIMNTIFGYWRCSTDAQDQERQIRALKDAGCEVIVGDHITGVSDYGDRRELSKLLDQLEAGSLLILDELNRLGRTMVTMLVEVNKLLEKGVKIKKITAEFADKILLVYLGPKKIVWPKNRAPRFFWGGGCYLIFRFGPLLCHSMTRLFCK